MKDHLRIHIVALLLLLIALPCQAAERLYFVPLVENNTDNQPQVVLAWGALEGNIPTEIDEFIVYRSTDGGSNYDELGRTSPKALPTPGSIYDLLIADQGSPRFDELLLVLDDIRYSRSPQAEAINSANFHTFLYEILDPSHPDFNPLQKMLICRYHPGVAQVAGLGLVDDKVTSSGTYHYLLTAHTAAGESLPIGKSAGVIPDSPTSLPAPTGLEQIHLAGCSVLRRGLDDLRVHLRWQVAQSAAEISEKILTYGYDLFWSENGGLAGLD